VAKGAQDRFERVQADLVNASDRVEVLQAEFRSPRLPLRARIPCPRQHVLQNQGWSGFPAMAFTSRAIASSDIPGRPARAGDRLDQLFIGQSRREVLRAVDRIRQIEKTDAVP
jgi:hypothetical protein